MESFIIKINLISEFDVCLFKACHRRPYNTGTRNDRLGQTTDVGFHVRITAGHNHGRDIEQLAKSTVCHIFRTIRVSAWRGDLDPGVGGLELDTSSKKLLTHKL